MMTKKRTIAAATVVLVVAAAVIGWWQLTSGEKPLLASAFAVVSDACDGLAEVNHDAVVVTTDDEARVVQTFEVSGGNQRMVGVVYEPPDSDTVTAKGELVLLDGVAYARESSPEHPTILGAWEVWHDNLPTTSGPETPCFGADSTNVRRSDDSERHFIWRTEIDGNTVTKYEFWVDANGRPVRSTITDTDTSSATRDSTPSVDVIAEISYSGFGEENIITAPIAPPPSRDQALSALALSDVTFSYDFSYADIWYTASVANDVEQTTVSPTTRDDGATYVIKLDEVADADGVIPLAVGENVIIVEVTAEDGQTTRSYGVAVTRAASELPPEPTPDPTPTQEAVVDSGNPSASDVTGTSVRVSWDRVRLPTGTILRDIRVNYRTVGEPNWTFGAYVETATWSSRRQATTVSGLTCGTAYEFQVEASYSNAWHHYGSTSATTGIC